MGDEIKTNNEYNEIRELIGLEPVRVRPGMYIGDTNSKGLHHMIWEIVDNSIDEAMAGFATRVIVTLTKQGSVIVDDDGRGIPVKLQANGKTGVEMALCKLHAGGKFGDGAYKVSGGLHGVGASVVNALSQWMKVWVKRDNQVYYAEFNNKDEYHQPNGGTPVEQLKVIDLQQDKTTGTNIEFYPDFSIMEKNPWDREIICNRLKQLAYLNKGIKIVFIDNYSENIAEEQAKIEWLFEGGLLQYVTDINKDSKTIANIIYGSTSAELKSPDESNRKFLCSCEIAFQYTENYTSSIYSFCNNIHTMEGGMHEEGFKLALVRLLNNFAIEKKLLNDKDEPIKKEDIIVGLTAIISIKHSNPQYKGQTKGELGNSEVRPFTNKTTSDILEKYILENPKESEEIIKKVLLSRKGRKAAENARIAIERKDPFNSGSLPGKLADCSSKDPTICEMYLVEGDSAGGSAKMGRDSFFQAILPLRGKILNVEKASTDKIFANEEINAMITAIGIGVSPEFKTVEKEIIKEDGTKETTKVMKTPRYDKIIIMTDADVDGAHIRILLLTFFYRYMQPLIDNNHVYIAVPPLYKLFNNKITAYAYSDEELEELKKKYNGQNYTIQRYKGLGEMDPDQLWETTMDPTQRLLKIVTIEDAIEADKQFRFLMGDDVLPRKEFIAENAKFVKNLDI